MLNESVKNFLLGNVSGLTQAKTAERRAESGGAAGLKPVFGDEVRRIVESEISVSVSVGVIRGDAGYIRSARSEASSGDDSDKNTLAEKPSDDKLRQANDIMVRALMMISELLGMPEGAKFEPGYVMEFDSESVDQLADIVWGIDKALQMFEKIALTGPDFVVDGADAGAYPFSKMKNGGQLAEFTADLRVAKSHLELGFYMLDIQSVITERIAVKYGASVTFGMTQAANPSDLGMSVSDLAQVFSSLIREEMTSAMERLKMIASGQAEMTELERAALNMGVMNSGIWNAAASEPGEPIRAFDFSKVDLTGGGSGGGVGTGVNADVNTNVNTSVETGINTGANTDVNTGVNAGVYVGNGTGNNVPNSNIPNSNIPNSNIPNRYMAGINTGTDTNVNANIDDNADAIAINVKAENVDTPNGKTQNIKKEAGNADVAATVEAKDVGAGVEAVSHVKAHADTLIGGSRRIAPAVGIDLPISVSDAARKKIHESVEAANRRALVSAESPAVKTVSAADDDGVGIPVSVTESANGKRAAAGNGSVDNAGIADSAGAAKSVNTADSANAERPAPKTAAASVADVPVSVNESVHDNRRPARGEKPADGSAKPAAAESASAKLAAVGSDSAGIPVSVMAAAENRRSSGEKSAANDSSDSGKAGEKSSVAAAGAKAQAVPETPARAGKPRTESESPTSSSGKYQNAQADGNVGANVNANVSSNVNAAGQSTESGIGMAFANKGNIGEPVDNIVEIDNNDSDLGAQAEIAESKASQTLDKVEKTVNTFSRLDNEALIRQLTERMHQAVRNGAHEIRMVLRPEALGELRMSIRVQGDVVMAKVQVENRQVKSIIESNMQSLKDQLEKHNLHLDGFSVDVGTDSDKSPRQAWREMAEASENLGNRKFRQGAGETGGDLENGDNLDPLTGAAFGSDTGRRFGSNTFEYFI